MWSADQQLMKMVNKQDVDRAPAVGRGLPTPEDIGVGVGHVDRSE
jgi:hypothetical protein